MGTITQLRGSFALPQANTCNAWPPIETGFVAISRAWSARVRGLKT
jgi:hypothetical protein